MPNDTISPVALAGFSAADNYDTHRPSYDAEAVSDLLQSVGVANKPGAHVLDLAAGTGKFTEILSARPELYDIVAVEPHNDMRKTLQNKGLRRVEVKEGIATNIPAEDGWADAVVVAQAFHWFATEEALREISRVLRPAGSIGLIWNVEDYNQARSFACNTSWEAELRTTQLNFKKDTNPRFPDGKWREIFNKDIELPFQRPICEKTFGTQIWLSRDALWHRLGTRSNVANLEENEREQLKKEFDRILNTANDLTTNEEGEIAVHTACHIAWTVKA